MISITFYFLVALALSLKSNMALKLSPTVQNIALSKTIEMHALTMEIKAEGKTVYSLCVGEPDYQPPQEVADATVRSFSFNKMICLLIYMFL
jgi:hypothetical protein